VFGTSVARSGEITATKGVIDQSNFQDYSVARINEVPSQTNAYIVESDAPPAGVGEPGVRRLLAAFLQCHFCCNREESKGFADLKARFKLTVLAAPWRSFCSFDEQLQVKGKAMTQDKTQNHVNVCFCNSVGVFVGLTFLLFRLCGLTAVQTARRAVRRFARNARCATVQTEAAPQSERA